MRPRPYAAIYGCAVRHQLRYLKAFLGRNVFFVVVLFTFYSLWRVIFAGKPVIAGFTMTQTLWYLTFTETIELGKARLHGEIQAEVRDGSVAYELLRPYSYAVAKVSRAMGESTVKMLPILSVGSVVALAFTGPLDGFLAALPFGMVLLAGGTLLNLLWLLLFGLLAFWIEEVSPFTWLYQKLVFIVGGMFFPIDFFPTWMQGVARALPFSFTAYWPALTLVKFSRETFLHALAGQAIYIVAVGSAVALLYRVARRKVHAHGG